MTEPESLDAASSDANEPPIDGAPDAAERAQSRVPSGGLAGSLSRAASGEALTKSALLDSIGGYRGILESILPGIVFLVTYVLTHELVPSVIAPVAIGLVFFVIRLAQRQPLVSALSGLVGIAFCVVIALLTGRALDYYVTGFFTNIAWGLGLLISVLVGWPLIGVAIGFLTGQGTAWRKDRRSFRVMMLVTLLWVGVFGLRLLVQLPMYYAEQIEALGVARLVMGIPLFVVAIGASWLIVRSTLAANKAASSDADTALSTEGDAHGENDAASGTTPK
ncbi:DUF3159 domain-containing protein [Lysinibacter cavernae]|uniref:DUF3159 domain-containing protein n=1 Tax=Lysinibacter cavernae TaxID=1640652 RepID=A0A7X5QZ62_9MICO|nr:DUF3159 domain-containing protein [Lysinibacter cavernae]NIH52666.1 hypothetical protein [Lysinibacter cavernae]